jgi:hypothetical protein
MAEDIVTVFKADVKEYEAGLKVIQKGLKDTEGAERELLDASQRRLALMKEELADLQELRKKRDASLNPKVQSEYNKRINEAKAAIQDHAKALNVATDQLEGYTEQSKEAAARSKELGEVGGKAFALLDKATFGLAGKMVGLYKSVMTVAKGMNVLKIAIASTGIGALVLALGAVITYFTQTEKGAKMVKAAMAGIGAAVKVVVDRFGVLGEAVLELFQGNFAKAAELAKQSVQGIGAEIANETKTMYNLTKALQSVEAAEVALIATNAEREKRIAALRLQVEDETLSIKARTNALKEASSLEDQIAADNIKNLQERLRLQKIDNDLSDADPLEDLRKENELIAQIAQAEVQRDMAKRKLASGINALNKEAATAAEKAESDRLAALKAEEEARKALFQLQIQLVQDAADNEKVELDILYASKLISQEDYLRESAAIEAIRVEQMQKLYDKESQAYKELELSKIQSAKAYNDFLIAEAEKAAKEAEEAAEVDKKIREAAEKDLEEATERRREQNRMAFDGANSFAIELSATLANQSAEKISQIEAEGQANDQASQRKIDNLYKELETAEGADRTRIRSAINTEKGLQKLNAETTQKNLEQERKRMANYKKAQLVATTIAEAVAIGRSFSDLGPIAGGIAAVALVAKFAFLLSQIESQEFAEGTDFVKPKNSRQGKKVDDIPAMLTEGEAVIPVKRNKEYSGLVASLVKGDPDDFINRHYVIPRITKEIMGRADSAQSSVFSAMLNDANIVNYQRKQIQAQMRGTDRIVSAIESNRKHSRDVA